MNAEDTAKVVLEAVDVGTSLIGDILSWIRDARSGSEVSRTSAVSKLRGLAAVVRSLRVSEEAAHAAAVDAEVARIEAEKRAASASSTASISAAPTATGATPGEE